MPLKDKENQHGYVKEPFICIDNDDQHEKDDTQFDISMVSNKLIVLNIINHDSFKNINDDENYSI